jgi:hypothetical protein
MSSNERPIAATAAQRDAPARAAGRGRLSTVRLDFFLDPAERLTEQERALMTAMLHCLVGDIAAEIRAGLPSGWAGANDDESALIDSLTRAGLLDDPELIALLLRRADEERIGSAARARSGRHDSRAIQTLVSHPNGEVSAATMGLILARGRRRDRFGQCLIGFDDLGRGTAERLVYAIAAVIRRDAAVAEGVAAAHRELGRAVAAFLERHEPERGIDALTTALVAALDSAGGLTDDLLLASSQEGEVGFLAHVVAVRAGIAANVARDELLSGSAQRLMLLLRLARFSRDLSAALLAGVGDLLGIGDAGEAIGIFDALSDEEVSATATWLTASPSYRSAIEAVERTNG